MRNTLDNIRRYFADQGCELLEDQYVNAHVRMRYRCVCGKESCINLNNFQNGKRCGCGRVGLHRLTDDELRLEVEDIGYQFISSEFLNGKHVITCVCCCGEKRCCELKNLRRSSGCRKCRDNAARLKFEDVKKHFSDNGCELLETNYVNAHTLMNYKCICGAESRIVFDSFKNGNRCKDCGSRKLSKRFSGCNHPNWNPDRGEVKSNLYFRKKCCSLLKITLKCVGRAKNNKTSVLLGYNYKELRDHLRSHPNWAGVSNHKWHIDHVFPIKAFLDFKLYDLKLINCLENLQPMLCEDNLSKHAKYNREEFIAWLKQKGIL